MHLIWMGGLLALINQAAFAGTLPVAKDASLIESSLCCGPGAADRNFGSSPTVDAGRYHHKSRALIGFDLQGVDPLQSVQLVLAGSTVGSGPADFALSLVTEEWDENTVTYRSAPASVPQIASGSWVNGQLRFDVTELVHEALAAGQCSVSFIIDARGGTNLFIPSRENTSGLQPAFLELNAQ